MHLVLKYCSIHRVAYYRIESKSKLLLLHCGSVAVMTSSIHKSTPIFIHQIIVQQQPPERYKKTKNKPKPLDYYQQRGSRQKTALTFTGKSCVISTHTLNNFTVRASTFDNHKTFDCRLQLVLNICRSKSTELTSSKTTL